MPPFLTSEEENHNHLFIGMNSGSVHIFDIKKREFSNFTIRNQKRTEGDFANYHRENRVSDIKCQPDKMHRLLIAHERSQVCVYSMNKQSRIQEINLDGEDRGKGRILACEWIYSESANESNSFVIGYSEGALEIFKAESKS